MLSKRVKWKLWCVVLGCGWDVTFVYKYIDIYTSICKGYTRFINAPNSISHTPYRYMDNNDHGLYAPPYMYVRTCDYISQDSLRRTRLSFSHLCNWHYNYSYDRSHRHGKHEHVYYPEHILGCFH